MRPTIAEDSIPKFQFRAGIRWYAASTIKAYGTGTSWPWPARSIACRLYRHHGHSEASSRGPSRNTSRAGVPPGSPAFLRSLPLPTILGRSPWYQERRCSNCPLPITRSLRHAGIAAAHLPFYLPSRVNQGKRVGVLERAGRKRDGGPADAMESPQIPPRITGGCAILKRTGETLWLTRSSPRR
jgi:hypothetical protein